MQQRQFHTQFIIGIFFVLVVCVALLSKADATSITLFGLRLPEVCLFRRLTGYDCPGCGLSRAVVMALHGQFYESYMRHVLGGPVALLLLLQIPYRFAFAFSSTEQFVSTPGFRKWLEISVSACILVPWIGRIFVVFYTHLHTP